MYALGRRLCRSLIRETSMYTVDEYPDYDLLEQRSKLRIETDTGDYDFLIKEDTCRLDKTRFFLTKHRVLTVELSPVGDVGDNRDLYIGKIMMSFLVWTPLPLKKCVIYGLVDEFLKLVTVNGIGVPVDLNKHKEKTCV